MKRTIKIIKKTMTIFIIIVALVSAAVYLYMQKAEFGQVPSGVRLEAVTKSTHYKEGAFQNIHYTPTLTEGYSMFGVMSDQLFKNFPRRRPVDSLPSVKTDLHALDPDSNVLVWFGHSSYFIQLDGKRFLIDPVFSGNASPIPGTNTAFKGADIYKPEDMPAIDYLLITHDHYDHLDYETILALKGKIDTVICGLGVGGHFERWGYDVDHIIEKDWYEHIPLASGFSLDTAPTRHFSGRGFKRNNTLWLSFILKTPSLTLYLGGDSGYDTHFKEIGDKFGQIDLALLDNGQYNKAWQAIHMLPEEVIKASGDLNTKRLFPVHSSKFMLAQHPWDEPLSRTSKLAAEKGIPLVTPMIGEVVRLTDPEQVFKKWWEGVE
ncbi:MBL fold metallo-hydrolase [Sphingobacterium spiritivorum]|uniref:MBL fold metallo-hydrolase n=1 Tax=Sphingobacterium spiritivorum TaxID=258 RepID=UPI003DA54D94